MFNIITGINELKTLTKHISCECKCKFDGKNYVDMGVKNVVYVKKYYVWNPATQSCENGKYFTSIMGDSAITCDEIIDMILPMMKKTKTIPANFNEKKATCKTQNFYILLTFLLITIALLIAVSIYCCLIKYQAK